MPTVSLSTSDNATYAGATTPLVLNCNISVDPAFDNFVNVSVTWIREMTIISNNTDNIRISPLSRYQSVFVSTLTLSPPSVEDNANFTCRASAIPSDELASAMASDPGEDNIAVVVHGKHP